eukprot:TRINITY_DN87405_c0_g1_i1.p1 TRINITY_DN87405_c0_g1~~TRINITY_DN87405_c0_g1_i1.p1  ORF type:complete len:548 (-),score=70.31 TRINITY_DN87405_c0_g1_i1:64-1707(-)
MAVTDPPDLGAFDFSALDAAQALRLREDVAHDQSRAQGKPLGLPGKQVGRQRKHAKEDTGGKDVEDHAGFTPPARTLKPAVSAETAMRRRWWIAGDAFVQMLIAMRTEFVEGKGYMQGLQCLLGNPPKGQVPWTGGDNLTFDDFAAGLLYDTREALQSKPGCSMEDVQRLMSLLRRLEGYVVGETHNMKPENDWTSQPEAFGRASWAAAAKAKATPAFSSREGPSALPMGGFGAGQRFLVFVGLPLALYCADCPHLYTVLQRLRALGNADGPLVTPQNLRTSLDCDGRPYSVLIYALVAALQALDSARPPSPFGSPFAGLEPMAPRGGALMFRGLWVPEIVNEHWADHSWAFNSFSRSIDGVLSVLNFYALAEGSAAKDLAHRDAHILLLVANLTSREGGSRWAYPVQLFAGGESSFPASVEQEVLVPPFSRYFFEPDLEVCTSQAPEERLRRLQAVAEKWRISLTQDAVGLQQLLEGKAGHRRGLSALTRPLRVTVRFIRTIEPLYAMRELLNAGAAVDCAKMRLLKFPAAKSTAKGARREYMQVA